MFRRTRVALVPVVAALAVAALAVAVAAPADARTFRTGVTAADTDDTARTLVATGTARVRGVPDLLTMTLGVSSRGSTVGEALDRNNTAANRVMKVLTDAGIDKKDIQTSNFSIGPVYDDRGSEITGYQVSNTLTVQLRDIGAAGAVIDDAAQAGGDDVVMRGVSFGFDDTSALVAQARAEAVKRARAQAEQLAGAAGVELVSVRTISESSPDLGPVLAAPEAAQDAAAMRAVIEPGSEELSVVVTVVYTIR